MTNEGDAAARLASIAGIVVGLPVGAVLSEPEAQRVSTAIGVAVPQMVGVRSAAEAASVSLPGDQVVVKVVGPAHKTERGGVIVVPNHSADIERAAARILTSGGDGVLVAEFVAHDLGSEILAGVRWTEAFGPVVTIGPGGIVAERSQAAAMVSSATIDAIGAAIARAEGTRRVTTGWRGSSPAATSEQLAALARRLLALGVAAMPHHLTEFEINPLVFTAAGPVALDALAVVGGTAAPQTRPRPAGAIARQLHPRSIAVLGVSQRLNPGRVILRNILAAGFPPDRVTVIKPAVGEIDGCRCVSDPESLPEPVDLMILAIDASVAPEVMERIAASGKARSVILIPGGLGEVVGTEGAADRIRTALRTAARPLVVTGPNSMGIRSLPGRYDATFIPRERVTPNEVEPLPPCGGADRAERGRWGVEPDHRTADGTLGRVVDHASLAVISQSGAFALSRLDRMPWLQPRYVVTVGNQLDLSVGDYLEHFAADPAVEVVACYLEGIAPGDGDRILRAVNRIRGRGGMVLWYRGGRTPAGAGAAATHTAALATDDAITRFLGQAVGVLEANSLDDFDDLLQIAVRLHHSDYGKRVGVITNAGFEAVAAADAGSALALAEFGSATATRLQGILEAGRLVGVTAVRNPLDLTPMADDETFAAVVQAVLDDPGVDVAVVGCVPFSGALRTMPKQIQEIGSLPERLAALATHSTPWIAVVDAGRLYQPMTDRLTASGVPVLRTMDRAVRLLGEYGTVRSQ